MKKLGAVAIIIIVAILNFLISGALPQIQSNVSNLASDGLNVIQYLDDMFKVNISGGLSSVFMGVGTSLLMLGFIKKGFETYISYTDGDPDSNPLHLLVLFGKALIVLLCFDTVYNWIVSVITSLSSQALTTIRNASNTNWTDWAKAMYVQDNGANILGGVLVLIFCVIYYVAYFSVVKNGVEIFILKLGMPVACVGLLNADKGIFKNYMMSFIKAFVTILVKMILLQISVSIITVSASIGGARQDDLFTKCFGLLIGIACASLALSTPKLLAEFMVPSSGGGSVVNKAYYTANAASKVINAVK